MFQWIRQKIYRYRCLSCGHCFLINHITHRCEKCQASALVEE